MIISSNINFQTFDEGTPDAYHTFLVFDGHATYVATEVFFDKATNCYVAVDLNGAIINEEQSDAFIPIIPILWAVMPFPGDKKNGAHDATEWKGLLGGKHAVRG